MFPFYASIFQVGGVHYHEDPGDADEGVFSPNKNGNESPQTTPAFPVSPETPYGEW